MLVCSSCESSLGEVDPESLCLALSKSSISVSTSDQASTVSLARQKWPACALLTAVEHQGLRKLIVNSRNEENRTLSVWVFAPAIRISSSNAGKSITQVAKVMWKGMTRKETALLETSLNSKSLSLGTLELAAADSVLLEQSLRESATTLPVQLRTLQDWKVGLLELFTQDDLRQHPA